MMMMITAPLWALSAGTWAAWVGVHLACEALRETIR